MINRDKWINTLPENKIQPNIVENHLNDDKWVNTISKKNSYNSVKNYSLILVFFVSGLLFVSAVKNETRNLEKEIIDLEVSVNVIKDNLNEAILDNEVITSPENISLLAKQHLSGDFIYYKNSQIKILGNETQSITKKKTIQKKLKSEVAKRIKIKKQEIKKLQDLYSQPEKIPEEIKTSVARQIYNKKIELKQLYNSPKDIITIDKFQKWGAVQVVKAFLGIPMIPGR